MSAERDNTGTIEIKINRHAFRIPAQPISGAELRHVANPPLPDDQDLVQVTASSEESDLFVADDQVIDFENGVEFLSVPRAIMAGLRHG